MSTILNASSENDVLYQQRIRVRLNHDIITTVNAVQCDTAREFIFFFDDYEVPDGTELRIYIRKPSGKEIYNYCAYINGDIIYQPTVQSLAEVGESLGQIQIIKNHVLLTSFSFRIMVEENLIASSNITSTDEFLILNELIETARAEIDKLIELNKLVTKQEEERVEAEQLRTEAETQRNAAESQRNKNEEARKKAETDRATAESKRIEAEKKRDQAEQNRITKENERLAAETERVNAENTRKQNEEARKTAESKRDAAENTRVSNETARVSAETARSKAETARASAEKTRITNETNRVNAESARASAETAREKAEAEREKNSKIAVDNCNKAADRANEVVNNLQDTISNFIKDSEPSANTTYSSNKIEKLVSSVFSIGATQPVDQPINGIWLITEN